MKNDNYAIGALIAVVVFLFLLWILLLTYFFSWRAITPQQVEVNHQIRDIVQRIEDARIKLEQMK